MIELSVIIPAYNEQKRIGRTLRDIQHFLRERKIIYELLVVNDGSTDATETVARKYATLIKLPKNRGKGYAVRAGVLQARGMLILIMDADGSIPIGELPKLWRKRKQGQIIIGSRFLKGSRFQTQRISRMVVSKIGNILFRILFGIRIKDTQCGFKLLKRGPAQKIFKNSTVDRFGFDMELLVLGKRFDYSIIEVPIRWHDSPQSSIRAAQASWQTMVEILKFWWLEKSRQWI